MRRPVALFLAFLLLFSTLQPTIVWAVTSGPSQPEFASFTPFEQTSLVDNFTGDFKYNIPLMEIDGYPINLAYDGNVNQESEASWVGLGWSLNPGAVNHAVRGIPDDFKGDGDNVTTETSMRPRQTFSGKVRVSPAFEIVGYPAAKALFGRKKRPSGNGPELSVALEAGLTYDNYYGLFYSAGVPLNFNPGIGKGCNIGLSLGYSGQGGFSLSPSISLSRQEDYNNGRTKQRLSNSISLGIPFNSESGFTGMQLQASGVLLRNNKGFMGSSASLSFPFGSASYPPQLQNDKKNFSVCGTFSVGQEMFWVSAGLSFSGVYSRETIKDKVNKADAYGYMYHEEAKADQKHVITDYNREGNAVITPELPLLPVAYSTFDYYSVSGQGIGGSYRIHREQATAIYDQPAEHKSGGYDVGVEIDAVNLFKGGLDLSANFSTNRSGAWSEENSLEKLANDIVPGIGQSLQAYKSFYERQTGGSAGEKFCFKKAGELNETDVKFYNSFHGSSAAAIAIDREQHFTSRLIYDNGRGGMNTDAANISNYRNGPIARTQIFEQLTAQEATVGGFSRTIPIAELFDPADPMSASKTIAAPVSETTRVLNHRKGHHISEIRVTREDGARFIYGLPVYELEKTEYNFTLQENAGRIGSHRLAGYAANKELSDGRDNYFGLDGYWQKTTTSPHANAYLLTAMVSNDYVDVNDDGPSAGDIGTYVKFNYKKSKKNYKWRTPYESMQANYSAGNYSQHNDDKGVVTYGEKEQFYLKSVESKNYIAIFYTNARNDGFGVLDINGGRDLGNPQQRLDSIRLFSIADYKASPSSAVPIKTVHFRYDNSLCRGIPNSSVTNGGKLTLTKVFFTYRNSPKGELNPYSFSYDNRLWYKGGAQDMWGSPATYVNEPSSDIASTPLTNSEFPYVIQDQSADSLAIHASAWQLTDITMPTGGKIHVDYEADRYAFVQDKRAMQMVKILGFANKSGETGALSGQLFSTKNGPDQGPNNYIYFDVTGQTFAGKEDFQKKYIQSMEDLFFRFFIDLTGKKDYEFVSGYAEIDPDDCGYSGNRAWIKVKAVELENPKHNSLCSPIAKLGWQNTRLYLNHLVNPSIPLDFLSMSAAEKAYYLNNSIRKLAALAEGFNASMRDFGFSKDVVVSRSFIRLNAPTLNKAGGGSRVSKLTFSDGWDKMAGTGYREGTYGYTYTYTTDHKLFGIISSGVAQWEPNQGGDENPNRGALAYGKERYAAPNDNLVCELPAGMGLYPDPGVGYSEIKVEEFKDAGSKGVGHSVYKFYTAKDFPVISSGISPDYQPKNTTMDKLIGALKLKLVTKLYASQGLSLEFSNMHGVAKSEEIWGADNNVISKAEYFYKCEEAGSTAYNDPYYRLKNTCDVLRPNGSKATTELGIDFDVACDFREYKSVDYSGKLGLNLDVSFIGIFGLPIFSGWPGFQSNQSLLRTASMIKTTTRYPILESVRKTDMSSVVTERSLVYDAQTGGVLITALQNQYEDTYYKTSIPAYFAYPDMGPVYKRSKLNLGTILINAGIVQNTSVQDGDVVLSDQGKFWIVKSGNTLTALDYAGGKRLTDLTNARVLDTAAKNQLSSSILTFSSKDNPLRTGYFSFTGLRTIDAEASVFSRESMIDCACPVNAANANPYTNGTITAYLPKTSYKFLYDRKYTAQVLPDLNPRNDGYYIMQAIWQPSGNKPWLFSPSGWVATNVVNLRNPNNAPLESVDALNQYSSAHFTYNQKIPKSMAQNARYRQTLFEHFEEAANGTGDEKNCLDQNISLPAANISSDKAHSGRQSVKVNAKSNVSVKYDLVCPK